MVYKNFAELTMAVKNFPSAKRMAVAAAEDRSTLEAVMRAQKEEIASPILIGCKDRILGILTDMGTSIPENDIIDEPILKMPPNALSVSITREKQTS